MGTWAFGPRAYTLNYYAMLPLAARKCLSQTLQAGQFIHVHNLSGTWRGSERSLSLPKAIQMARDSVDFKLWVSRPNDHVPLTMDTASGKVQAIQCQQGTVGKGENVSDRKWAVGETVGRSAKCGYERACALCRALQMHCFRALCSPNKTQQGPPVFNF